MLKKTLTRPLILLVYILLIIEDFVWEYGKKILAHIGSHPGFKQIENIILKLPPYGALASLCLPAFILFPANILAIYLTSHHFIVLGVILLIGMKLLGTMIIAHLFTINKDKLLSLTWFKYIHNTILFIRNRAVLWLHSQPYYQYLKSNIDSFNKWWSYRKTNLILRIRRHLKRGRIKSLTKEES